MTREEAVDVLCNTDLYPGRCNGKIAFSEALNMAISALKAQSDNDDIISRRAAIAEFSCCELTPDGGIDANYAIDFLEHLPPALPDMSEYSSKLWHNAYERGKKNAQSEIVRCKDCKWKQGAECVRFAEIRPFPNDFCSRAEGRADCGTDVTDKEGMQNGW